MRYDPDKHHRRSIRLKGADYTLPGSYFVTVCTCRRESFLGTIRRDKMILSPLGIAVRTCWDDLPRHYANVKLDEFVVMPNHIHGIVVLSNVVDASPVGAGPVVAGLRPAPTTGAPLTEIVRAMKSFSARRINELRDTTGAPVWQRNYYEHIVRNEDELDCIREYIVQNPLRWTYDQDNLLRQR